MLLFTLWVRAAETAVVGARPIGQDDWLQHLPLLLVVLTIVLVGDGLAISRIVRARRRAKRIP